VIGRVLLPGFWQGFNMHRRVLDWNFVLSGGDFGIA
jgi:hypothetical protein